MKLLIKIILVFFLCIPLSFAVERVTIKLEKAHITVQDTASLLRGAKFFATNCMACHTMKYLLHNKIATEAGITLDKMPLKNKEWWLGVVPPDLTLITTQRGADWVLTYLQSFYVDKARPSGYNNLLFKNSNMTNILAAYQGQQVLTKQGEYVLTHPATAKKIPYYTALRLEKSGSMTPEQFHETMYDLVNFLTYAADPGKVQRENLGWWVLLFLVILFVLSYLLKRAYWKDVK